MKPSSPTATSAAGADRFVRTARPTVMGLGGVVSAGHYLASAAGAVMLARGGNAVDAGVAAGLVLNVVHNDMNTLSGVAPIALHDAASARAVTIAGIGAWPRRASHRELLESARGIPDDLRRSVVPAAAGAWLRALREHGTMSFAEVSEPARRHARDGFPVHSFMHKAIGKYLDTYRANAENRRLYLVDDAPPPVGWIVRQPELHATLEAMVRAEARAGGSRERGLEAVHDFFYRGPVARAMVEFSREHGGWLELDDLEDFEARVEPEARLRFHEWEVVSCGPWSQGPALLFALNALRHVDLRGLPHNSAGYVNAVASALDLAFADRNAYCGDPAFVDVPMSALLSDEYGALRAALIPPDRAFREPCAPGDPRAMRAEAPERRVTREDFGAAPARTPADTSCVTAADAAGNFFAATPSDGYCNGPVIPGLGLHISERGSQSFLDARDPNVMAPGKRPRLTPNPTLFYRDGQPFAAMATPGNDRQVQAILQVFLNLAVFGFTPQEAVEAPRFASYNFRASTWPGNEEPGRLCLEEGIDDEALGTLASWGRQVARWPRWTWSAGGVCLSARDANGLFQGASDPRREGYAIAL